METIYGFQQKENKSPFDTSVKTLLSFRKEIEAFY